MRTPAELEQTVENLEFRVLRLQLHLDHALKDGKSAINDCEKAMKQQAATIQSLQTELADAQAGIEWRDAEIRVLKTTLESVNRDREHQLRQFTSEVKP
jgi:exonuclease VII small subunit